MTPIKVTVHNVFCEKKTQEEKKNKGIDFYESEVVSLFLLRRLSFS